MKTLRNLLLVAASVAEYFAREDVRRELFQRILLLPRRQGWLLWQMR